MIFFAHQDIPAKVNVRKNAGHPERALDNLETPGKANIAAPNLEKGATPENPWEIGDSGRSGSWSGIGISPGSAYKHTNKGKEEKEENLEKFTEVASGKRKRTIPKKFSSPYALDQPGRRPTRSTRPSVSKGTVTTFPSVLLFTNIYIYCIYLFMYFVCSSEL